MNLVVRYLAGAIYLERTERRASGQTRRFSASGRADCSKRQAALSADDWRGQANRHRPTIGWTICSGDLCSVQISARCRLCNPRSTLDGNRETPVQETKAMKKQPKHPEAMSASELAQATRKFDRSFVFEKARPMTPAERQQERTLRRGRPKIGKGAKKVSISLETDLLQQTDALAKRRGINRSQLIADFVLAGLKRKAG